MSFRPRSLLLGRIAGHAQLMIGISSRFFVRLSLQISMEVKQMLTNVVHLVEVQLGNTLLWVYGLLFHHAKFDFERRQSYRKLSSNIFNSLSRNIINFENIDIT